jgi:glycogen synthase
MEDPWADLRATSLWIERLSAAHRPDLVHMNTFAPVRCRRVPVLLTAHSCVLTWWRAVHGQPAPAAWNRYRRLARESLQRASFLTVPTRALLTELRAIHGSLPPARVIPNGRSVDVEPSSSQRRERLVLSVGRVWDEGKNVRALAQAAPAINARVAVIGPGAVDGVEGLGVLDQEDVLRWLRRAAVFAEPARYEPFGLAALEAALCGCALVLGDIPSLREVWGHAASFVSPDDPLSLAREINALLEDPLRRADRAVHTSAVASGYTADAMADAYLEAYEQVARAAVVV